MSNPYPPFNPQDGYGQSPYAQYQPPPSTAMATWALVLSFIPFLPTILTSVGLAIAALVRSRNGRNFGRRRAIVALVIDALWFVGFVVLVVLIVLGKIDIDDTKRDAEGHVIEANVTTVDALKVGDCFDQEDTLASGGDSDPVRVEEVTVKPCSALHHFEEYAEFTLPEGDYPGEDAINTEANDRCFAEVRAYVGPEARPKLRRVSIYFYYPLKLDWNLRHDRIVQCMFAYEGEPHSGSLKKG
jgi:hypothetical protein